MAAARYDAHAAVPLEIGRRLLERLDYVRVEPQRILDVGSGTGAALGALQARYRKAQVIALDRAPGVLRHGRAKARTLRWFLPGRRNPAICAESAALPLQSACIDLLWSNLMLAASPDLPAVVAEWQRVMRVGGLLMFATLGPDTLRELRQALGDPASPFPDMHDVGDALVAAGFADPVMDMERLTLTYAGLPDLLREWRALRGAPAPAVGRRSRAVWSKLATAYPRGAHAPRWPVTVEVVYGHAWKLRAPPAVSAAPPGAPSPVRFFPRPDRG